MTIQRMYNVLIVVEDIKAAKAFTVATLMGHSDATTLTRNYQHLAKLPAVMQEAARKATANIRSASSIENRR
jgi:integrase